jgi:hypothetical protein
MNCDYLRMRILTEALSCGFLFCEILNYTNFAINSLDVSYVLYIVCWDT